MEQKIIGELFGVEIHSPIIRSEVREAVKQQFPFRMTLQESMKITQEQSFLEVYDIYESFLKNLSAEDKGVFEKIFNDEVAAAPMEWFSESKIASCGSSAEFLATGNAGELYGIQVAYPFTRDNIRKLVHARNKLMKSMASSQGISLYQASNDLGDIQVEFTEKFNYKDQEDFLNLMTEEMVAHTNAINDETAKINQQALEQEISNQNLTSTMAGIIVFCCLMFLFFVVFK